MLTTTLSDKSLQDFSQEFFKSYNLECQLWCTTSHTLGSELQGDFTFESHLIDYSKWSSVHFRHYYKAIKTLAQFSLIGGLGFLHF